MSSLLKIVGYFLFAAVSWQCMQVEVVDFKKSKEQIFQAKYQQEKLALINELKSRILSDIQSPDPSRRKMAQKMYLFSYHTYFAFVPDKEITKQSCTTAETDIDFAATDPKDPQYPMSKFAKDVLIILRDLCAASKQ